MRLPSVIAAAAVCVSACVTAPSERIADTLTSYGIERQRAECVGVRLQRNLSVGQLLELSRLAQAYRQNDVDAARLNLDDLLRVASQVRDPRVPLEVAKAAGNCGLVPSPFLSMVQSVAGS